MTAASLRDDFQALIVEKRALLSATAAQMVGHELEVDALDHFYESTFLEVVTRFETFLEDLFYEVALGSSSMFRTGPVGAVQGVDSREDLEAALLTSSNRNYLDWLPYRNTLERARVVLRDGRPFSRLERRGSESALLVEILKIRNAIAHRSGEAWSKFENLCPGHLPVPRRTPAGLLQLKVGLTRTKYDVLCDGLGGIAAALGARSDLKAWALLSPEADRGAGETVPPGTYECVDCGNEQTIAAAAPMANCTHCHHGPCMACGAEKKSRFRRIAP